MRTNVRDVDLAELATARTKAPFRIGPREGRAAVLALAAALAVAPPAAALSFTDATAFHAAVSGLTTGTLDFEAIPADALLSGAGLTQTVGGTSVGVTFPASVPDVFGGSALDLQVNGLTSPGSHVLGTDDPGNFDQFIGGTTLSIGFTAPVFAFGLTLISIDTPGVTLLDGDLELTAGNETASLAVADRIFLGSANLTGGGTQDVHAYFLGVTAATPFATASLGPGAGLPDGAVFYWLDDFAVAVPEPATALLLGGGMVALAIRRPQRMGRTA